MLPVTSECRGCAGGFNLKSEEEELDEAGLRKKVLEEIKFY